MPIADTGLYTYSGFYADMEIVVTYSKNGTRSPGLDLRDLISGTRSPGPSLRDQVSGTKSPGLDLRD